MHGADIFTYIFSFFTSRYHGANRIFILISKREILFHTHGHDQPESSAIFRSINNTSAHAGIMIRFTDVFAKQFHAPGQQRVKTRNRSKRFCLSCTIQAVKTQHFFFMQIQVDKFDDIGCGNLGHSENFLA